MKRLLTSAVAVIALAAIAGQALAADATGTVTVNGSVASKCTVVSGGTVGGTTFSSTFSAGELADSAGHLAFSGSFTTVGAGDFQISCNKANPIITLNATPMTNLATAPAGYANTISYTAYADLKTINGSSTTGSVTRSIASGTGAGATNGPTALGSGLYLQNTTNNVVIRADTFATAGGATNILVGGAYAGVITLTITPA